MKPLQYFNLFGVLALTLLCVAQWQSDRRLNLEINRLEKLRLDHGAKIAEQEQSMQGLNADLSQFKDQFTKSQTELNETHQQLRRIEGQAKQLNVEREQLKTAVSNWSAAVASRDERLTQANAQIRKLADEFSASIMKYNELASNYNGVVKDLNELRARQTNSTSALK